MSSSADNDARRLLIVAAVLATASLPALLLRDFVADASALFALAAGPNPYFVPAYAGRLYVVTPLVVVSSFAMFMAPGLVGALKFLPRSLGEWVLMGFGSSVALAIVLGTVLRLVVGTPLSPNVFVGVWAAAFSAAVAWSMRQSWSVPSLDGADRRRILQTVAFSTIGVAVMVPKLFWEDLNIDGAEAFEFGRSLRYHVFPHWELHPGTFGFYNNFVLFAYVNHWFIALFGEVDAAARVPLLLYVGVIFAALTAIVESDAPRRFRAHEEALVWGGLVLYAFVQAYDTTYEPFSSDVAESAATDTLWVLFFLATIQSMWAGRKVWMCTFAYAAYMSSAGSPLLLAALAGLTFVFGRPEDKRLVKALAITLACGVVMGVLHHFVYIEMLLGGVKDQFSARNMASRLYPPNPFAWKRFSFLVLPAGILPALSFVLVRPRQSRTFIAAGVTLAYFSVIYISAWTGVHQFTPAMILPLVVFWRLYLAAGAVTKKLAPAYAAAIVVAFVVSIPPHFKINQAMRRVSHATNYRIGDYGEGYLTATTGAQVLYEILPEDYRMMYPDQPWGGDHLVWIRYALTRPARADTNYIVQKESDPAPPNATRAGVKDGAAIYVVDQAVLERHRTPGIPTVSIAPVYEHVMDDTFEFFRAFARRSAAN